MKRIFAILLALVTTVSAQSDTLTMNRTTGQINIHPSAGATPNFTALRVGGVTFTPVSYGANVATFLATPSSANLAAAVTGETGTGALVFGTSPDFTTGATIGSVAIPTISSTSTLTNKTIAGANNTLTVRLANDVTGTLPPANGGTGATTVSGARANLGYVRNTLAATQTVTTNTTLANTNLVATLGAGTWVVRFVVGLEADSGTPGAKFDVALSTGSTTMERGAYWNSGAGAISFNSTQPGHKPLGANGPVTMTESRGTIAEAIVTVTVASSATVTFRVAQNTSSGDNLYIRAGSYVEIEPVDGSL